MNINWHKNLGDNDRKLIFGNESEDSLTKGYEKKRVVHAGAAGEVVPPEKTKQIWMQESSEVSNAQKLVYINIPFCQTKCAYCGFFKNFAKDELMESFTDALVKEIQQGGRLPFFSSGSVNAVYIGGGTPGALHTHQIERILSALNENIPMANDCEMTFETRTYQLTKEKIETCLNNGVNRFSLGVQSFNTLARKSIGRVDDGDIVAAKLEELKNYNSAAVAIDLMFGLPHQSSSEFLEDILTADKLEVDGISLYQLNVFENGKLDEHIKSGKIPKPPTTAEQAVYHINANKLMNDLGYSQASMSHWTRGTRDRTLYNAMSKAGHPMHAFGAGAGGRTSSYGYFTHVALQPYIKMVDAGMKPIMGMSRMPKRQKLINQITSQIDSGFIRFDILNREAGTDMAFLFEPLMDSWQQRGMVKIDKNIMRLTPVGQFWYVNMAQALVDVLILAENASYIPETAKIAAQN